MTIRYAADGGQNRALQITRLAKLSAAASALRAADPPDSAPVARVLF